jgi:hypothetical protein
MIHHGMPATGSQTRARQSKRDEGKRGEEGHGLYKWRRPHLTEGMHPSRLVDDRDYGKHSRRLGRETKQDSPRQEKPRCRATFSGNKDRDEHLPPIPGAATAPSVFFDEIARKRLSVMTRTQVLEEPGR